MDQSLDIGFSNTFTYSLPQFYIELLNVEVLQAEVYELFGFKNGHIQLSILRQTLMTLILMIFDHLTQHFIGVFLENAQVDGIDD